MSRAIKLAVDLNIIYFFFLFCVCVLRPGCLIAAMSILHVAKSQLSVASGAILNRINISSADC